MLRKMKISAAWWALDMYAGFKLYTQKWIRVWTILRCVKISDYTVIKQRERTLEQDTNNGYYRDYKDCLFFNGLVYWIREKLGDWSWMWQWFVRWKFRVILIWTIWWETKHLFLEERIGFFCHFLDYISSMPVFPCTLVYANRKGIPSEMRVSFIQKVSVGFSHRIAMVSCWLENQSNWNQTIFRF